MPLSGKEMLKLYLKDGWFVLRQEGSHVRVKKDGMKETIPMHKELHRGMEYKLLKTLRNGGRK
jgi:predicted RNA binding protein YcfA (HicA-like mRNA interferase family)